METPAPRTARERVRAELTAEITRAARRQLAETGAAGLSLRAVARELKMASSALYRYFPSKRAVVLALYDVLSLEYARRTLALPPGRWRERFLFALRTSLAVLGPHRSTLVALVPLLVGKVADVSDYASALTVPLVCYVVLFLFSLGAARAPVHAAGVDDAKPTLH